MSLAPRIALIGGDDPDGVVSLLTNLPRRPGCAIVVATDADHLAQRLAVPDGLRVVLVGRAETLAPDTIYILPSAQAAVLREGDLVPTQPGPGGRLDRLLRTLADTVGRDAVAVILGGTGADGVLGVKRLKEVGGLVLVEEPRTDDSGELPRAAIATGLVDQVASRADMPARFVASVATFTEEESDRSQTDVSDTLRDILALVRIRSGHDFSHYKRATLYRRVSRRMQVCQTPTIAEYLRHLRDQPAELTHLLRDFLISVTNFFRDPEAHATLARQVIPRLFADRGPNDHLRAWVTGCATGEEAYSLGILLLEHARTVKDAPQLQIFATDIDDEALTEARAGRYPDAITADVSPERLERFFVREGSTFRVSQELRELVLFSPHNVLRDPPFSRLDLVSCRNLLIYLNRDAQTRVLSVFHFGLRPDGFLFLGSSESAENSTMFSTVDPKARIFMRRTVPNTLGVDTIVTTGRWSPPALPPTAPLERTASIGELHHRLVERYAPPSILVNGDLDVIHLSEHAGRFLELSGGEPTRHVLRMILPALRPDLRTAIYAARQVRGSDARRITFEHDGRQRTVDLRVRALDLPELGPNSVLVYLDEQEGNEDAIAPSSTSATTLIEPVVREMEDELHRTRDQLRNTVEQYETSLEELKASNEELQAINEELRSASEELETSKEELQSVNEELTTLNHELKMKIDEVSHANSDLQNLMTSTDIGVVFLDRALNIKRYTPRALDLFNMIPSDLGRPLVHVTHRLDTDALATLAQSVLQTLRTEERDVKSVEGRRYLMRILPYRSLEDRIEGVVLTFVDVSDLREAVDARRRSEAALQASEARLGLALRGAPVLVLSLDRDATITWGTVLGREVPSGPLRSLDLFEPEWERALVTAVHGVFASGSTRRIELELWLGGQLRTYDARLEHTGTEVLVVGFDITPSKQAEIALRDADRRKDEFLATLSHELRHPLTPLRVALDVMQLASANPTKLEETRATMVRQVEALTSLVDDLLDISRITQGKIDLVREAVDLRGVIDAAVERMRPLITEQNHTLVATLPDGLRVSGDRARLQQVFTNLVANAAKYTPRGGKVEVRARTEGASIVVEVRDDGIGIAPETLPHIFELFVQGRGVDGRSRGGLGIGLHLVRRLVELHGGRVEAHSEGEDRGSRFVVSLPAA